ncbi:MAG: penicillin acylase family protein [Actinomycetota bacterium]
MSIEIIRDAYGIAHARADDRLDAFYAQGFVHATDRAWQMVFDRYKVDGRASELIGPRFIKQDMFARRVGIRAAAEADLALLEPDERAIFDSYAAGVTAGLRTADSIEFELLGLEPQPWTAVDCLASWKIRHVFMGSKAMKLWRARLLKAVGVEAMTRLATADGRDEVLIVPPGATERWHAELPEVEWAERWIDDDMPSDGSNSWGVTGEWTATGSPILAGDPHRLLESPSVYHQMQLACDSFDVIGFGVPGVPGFPHFGHNGEVAWCITHAMADDQDLYIERFDADGRYWDGHAWQQPERWTETIQVHESDPVEVEIVRTPRGPIVFGEARGGDAHAMRWTGSDEPRRGLACLGRMLEADSAEMMDQAMSEWVSPCNAMLIADRKGQLRFLHRGRIPIRPRANGWLPVPAWEDLHAWSDDVPFSELPRIVDPPEGWIVTANNRVVGTEYPYHLGMDYAAPNRARRIIGLLEALDDGIDAQDMAEIHADAVSLSMRALIERLRRLDPPEDEFEHRVWDMIQTFDGEMRRGSAAALVADAFRNQVLDRLMQGEGLASLRESPFPEEPLAATPEMRLGSALQRLITQPLRDQLSSGIFGDSTPNRLFRAAFTAAVASLRELHGDDPTSWRYDAEHVATIRHPLSARFPDAELDPPAVAVDGYQDTVCVSAAEPGLGVYHASVARYVFDLADREAGGWVVPLGVSGDARSKHHHDQQQAWVECELVPMFSDMDALKASGAEVQTLEREAR